MWVGAGVTGVTVPSVLHRDMAVAEPRGIF